MWSAVAPCDLESPAPSARSKHSATLIGDHVYLLGGRNGNLPMKDFWKYNLVNGRWQQLKPSGDKLPCLQEHSAVTYKDNIFVFGGEVGFSAGTETPLWVYEIKNNSWKKIRSRKGVATPKGRRGHTALVHRGTMLIYGGYQDLRGSCGELWAYHFETESWHLVSSAPTKGANSDSSPPPRHKHSAIIHDDGMWIYGGMTDLQERSDLWRWDIVSRTWSSIKTKQNPGPLHSHAACRLPSSMIIFGGERDGHPTNDLWKFNFSTELWEKINAVGLKPQPRTESVAFAVSELLLKDNSSTSLETKATRTRIRTCSSADRGNRHSSYFPNNRVGPFEKTYVFKPSNVNYTDGSDLAQQYSDNQGNRTSQNNKTSFLQEITKLSQLNISRLNNKCSYTVLHGSTTDSTESLLKQHASPPGDLDEGEMTTPTRGSMVKSKSAYVIKKKYDFDRMNPIEIDRRNPNDSDRINPNGSDRKHANDFERKIERKNPNDVSPVSPEENRSPLQKRRVEFNCNKKMPREPISVPNFSLLTLPTPVLTPVEAARLVFLDTDEENDEDNEVFIPPVIDNITQVRPVSPNKECIIYENFKTVKRGESYNSHLGYADNPLYQHIVNSSSLKFGNYSEVPEISDENISSTSDYASIETVNRLSSASNYSVKTNTPQEENIRNKNKENQEGPFGFCNPNYMGPDIKSLLNEELEKKQFEKLINTPDSVIEDSNNEGKSDEEDVLELQNYNGTLNKNTKVFYRHAARNNKPPRTLELGTKTKCRASSASRVEKNFSKVDKSKMDVTLSPPCEPFIPLYMFIVGGKEQGQVTVFQRPLSIWRLKLY